jgi:rubrerythrin
MSKTEKNLWEAFAGESQANRKYLAFADKAEKEGHKQVARLFRAAAHAETIHAHAHLRALKAIGDTAANLKEAIGGETHEFQEMYPGMIAEAKEEGHKAGERSFSYANEVEKIHAALYQKALDSLGSKEETDFHVCSVCGYTCEGEPPEKCPVCGANRKAFEKIA